MTQMGMTYLEYSVMIRHCQECLPDSLAHKPFTPKNEVLHLKAFCFIAPYSC